MKGLDYLSTPSGIIGEAQKLASEAFGAERTWFLVNGTTAGIQAAVLSTVASPEDTVILSRDCHQSAFSALVLSGAFPIWVKPEYDEMYQFASVSTENFRETLAKLDKPPSAALVVSPNYFGLCGDISELARECHDLSIPLLVDEAHGSHFAFHGDFPCTSLDLGADLVIQSTHKTLSAMTQASMLHTRGSRVNADRICTSLQILQSSSPNYLLMSSIDAARAHASLASDYYDAKTPGPSRKFSQLIEDCLAAKREISLIQGIEVLGVGGDYENDLRKKGRIDPLRITLCVSDLVGCNGFEMSSILEDEYGIVSELATDRCIVFIVTLSTTESDLDKLAFSLREISSRFLAAAGAQGSSSEMKKSTLDAAFDSTQVMSPREAFFGEHRRVKIAEAVGMISAEIVCPYPPGIPILYPGEEITENALSYLQTFKADGGYITGCSDTSLKSILVMNMKKGKLGWGS